MTDQRTLHVKTPLGPDVLLAAHMSGHEQLGAPFDYRVSVLSPDPTIDLSALLGQPASVQVELPAGSVRHFHGYVTDFHYTGWSGDHATYELTLRPWLWLLSLTSNCRIFQNLSVPEIVKQICREHGFSDFRESLSGSYQPREYCVQYRESDFNYLSRLLEDEGIYYFVEHEEGKHTVVFADSPSAHAPASGYESVPFYPPDRKSVV